MWIDQSPLSNNAPTAESHSFKPLITLFSMQVIDGYMHILIEDHQASGNYIYLTLDVYLTIIQHYKLMLF